MTSLPPFYLDMVEALGAEAADAVVRLFGGQRLYVPTTPPADHPVQRLGAALAQALAAHYGGETLEVPNLRIVSRRAVIHDMAAAGRSPNDIAAATGLTHRRVRQVLAETAPHPDQLELFG